MKTLKKIIGFISIAILMGILVSCGGLFKSSLPEKTPLAFEKAIAFLSRDLLEHVKKDQSLFTDQDKVHIMLIPFIDKYSGELPEVSRRIEKLIIKAGEDFKGFHLARLNSKNLETADYIIEGNIGLDTFAPSLSQIPQKHYHVSASVRNLRKIKIIKDSDVWISDQNLNYTPVAIYRDSPLYLKNNVLRFKQEPPSDEIDENYVENLETRAILVEAETAYEEQDYETALALFTEVSRREAGQILRTYVGLYLSNDKMGNFEEAERAISKIVAISVERYSILTIKFLFKVNSVEFIGDKIVKARYNEWLNQIGIFFRQTDCCLNIVGHCSHTGPETWNNNLSLDRATYIQAQLEQYYPEIIQHSKAIGRGFNDNIIGIGTDDNQDALDRRVELIIIDCNLL